MSVWQERVAATDWDAVRTDLESVGGALTGPLVTPAEAAGLAGPDLPRRRVTRYTLLDAAGRPYRSATPGRLGGHRRSKLYGRLDCPSALRAIAAGGYRAHRVFFADEKTAAAAGYRPCAVCLPEQYRRWKGRR